VVTRYEGVVETAQMLAFTARRGIKPVVELRRDQVERIGNRANQILATFPARIVEMCARQI
jgi:hypothetical protein